MPTSARELKRMSRKCNNCYVSGDEKQLFACSRCRSQHYCSKECQKADWKSHKPMCETNGLLESLLKQHENTPSGMLDRLTLVDGISLYELDQRLEKWVRWHNGTLMATTIQALRLPVDVTRARTHLLYIKLEPRSQAEHQGSAGKFFRVLDAEVMEVEDGMRRSSPWPESLTQLRKMGEESERSGEGYVTAAMIECPPLGVQTVPFGSMTARAMRYEVMHATWKQAFIRHIEEGWKPKVERGGAGRRCGCHH